MSDKELFNGCYVAYDAGHINGPFRQARSDVNHWIVRNPVICIGANAIGVFRTAAQARSAVKRYLNNTTA